MSAFERGLAQVDGAKAYQIDDLLLLRVSGELPTPCHTAFLQQSLLTVEPPTLAAGWLIRPDVRCAQVLTPYEHHGVFMIGSKRETIRLHHAGGELTVNVEDLTREEDSPEASGRPSGVGPRPLPSWPDRPAPAPPGLWATRRTSTSGRRSEDAIDKLPPQSTQIPDWLGTYTVVSIHAEVGGIGGFDRLAVKARG